LLAAAEADGFTLSGGGYRDPAAQVAVRRSNCGSSDYAVYNAPPSSCRPPTARPGSSQHELGLAIDFTWNGSIISSRSNAAFKWLAGHAGRYGLSNLPSEPWHWSTSGR
jgi:LAS superfamily LD-carboxypeptidase LdcB